MLPMFPGARNRRGPLATARAMALAALLIGAIAPLSVGASSKPTLWTPSSHGKLVATTHIPSARAAARQATVRSGSAAANKPKLQYPKAHPDSHGTGVFGDLVRAMTEPVARREGLAVIDVCTYNKDKLHLPRAIRWLASTWASHVEMADFDAQTYVGYDFARSG